MCYKRKLRDKERLNLVLLIHQFLSFVYMYDGHSEGVADRCNGSALRARLAASVAVPGCSCQIITYVIVL
jgi:hypothetical protein